ncbi:Uncharacterised protein [Mycobacteroides abscessus subsp. abscessus]|nr:Uncharacterised protein [Mycobacteroides abscessus subsp. abscessus]SKU79129.1 Uncharacterised protein [Mycobacteroides abscessus subsp. abscessus]
MSNSSAMEANLASIASRAAASPERWNTVRCMNQPPCGSVEYCASEIMLAPASARKALTAATTPIRSGHCSRSLPMSLEWKASDDPVGCIP